MISFRRPDRIWGVALSYGVAAPLDPSTLLPTGKRVYEPITITKPWGPATPQFFQSFIDNEVLTTVLLEFVKKATKGVAAVAHTITLSNATIRSIRQYSAPPPGSASTEPQELEDIAFAFQTIALTHAATKASALDKAVIMMV